MSLVAGVALLRWRRIRCLRRFSLRCPSQLSRPYMFAHVSSKSAGQRRRAPGRLGGSSGCTSMSEACALPSRRGAAPLVCPSESGTNGRMGCLRIVLPVYSPAPRPGVIIASLRRPRILCSVCVSPGVWSCSSRGELSTSSLELVTPCRLGIPSLLVLLVSRGTTLLLTAMLRRVAVCRAQFGVVVFAPCSRAADSNALWPGASPLQCGVCVSAATLGRAPSASQGYAPLLVA